MKVKIDSDIKKFWNDNLLRGDVTIIYNSQTIDPENPEDKNIISMDKISRAFKSDTCDEEVFQLINKFFHRRKMKVAKQKNKLIQ